MLADGRIAALGTADELKARIGRETVELFFADAETLTAAAAIVRGIEDPERLSLSVAVDGAEDVRRVLDDLADRGLPADAHRAAQAHPRRGLPGSDMTDSLTFIGRSLRHSVRSVDALLTAIFLPVGIMLMFVYVFGGAIDTGGRYVDYVVPGIIVLCAAFGSAGTAVAVAMDMTTGVIDRFRTLPISQRRGADRPRRGQRRPQRRLGAARARRRAAGRLPADHRPAQLARAPPALLLAVMIAISWIAASFGLLVAQRRDRERDHVRRRLRAVRLAARSCPRTRCRTALDWVADHQPVTPIADTLRALMLDTPLGNELDRRRWRGAPRAS